MVESQSFCLLSADWSCLQTGAMTLYTLELVSHSQAENAPLWGKHNSAVRWILVNSSFLRARLTFKHSNQRNIVGLQKKGEFVRGTFLLEGNSFLLVRGIKIHISTSTAQVFLLSASVVYLCLSLKPPFFG